MEPLRHDDPPRLGPYVLLHRLDTEASAGPAAERRFLARTSDGHRTVLVTAPAPGVEPAAAARFLDEAELARTLGSETHRVPRLAPVVAVAAHGEPVPWYASPFVPGIPLPEALAVHGGPLPERTLRALGAALALCLDRLHATGNAHAGLSPRTVLVTADGARLTGLGALRATVPDGDGRRGIPGIPPEFVPPEQAAGAMPRPPGDVHALGAVLTYAGTGRTSRLSPDALPPTLAAAVRSCMAADPAHRPTASELLAGLVDEPGPAGPGQGSDPRSAAQATVLDPQTDRAERALRSGWLPRRIAVALAVQSSEALAARLPEGEQSPEEPDVPDAGPATTVAAHAQPHRPRRRGVLTGLAAATAGLAAGGAATWAATAEEPVGPTAAQRLAAGRRTRGRRPTGMPPNPRWHRRLRLSATPDTEPVIWSGRLAVVLGGTTALGVDLDSGDVRWKREVPAPNGPAELLDGGLALVPGDGLRALDVRTGKQRWATGKGSTTLLAADGDLVWYVDGDQHVVAYDGARGRSTWRVPVPAGTPARVRGHLLDDVLLLCSAAPAADGGRARSRVVALSRTSGKKQWARTYDGPWGDGEAGNSVIADDGSLVVADGGFLRGHDLKGRSPRPSWKLRTAKYDHPESPSLSGQHPSFGKPVPHKGTVYVTDGEFNVWAVDAATGKRKWQAWPGFTFENVSGVARTGLPLTRLTPSGRLVLCANPVEVDAFDAEVGNLLWRFTDLRPGARGSVRRRTVALTDEVAFVLCGSDAYLLPLS